MLKACGHAYVHGRLISTQLRVNASSSLAACLTQQRQLHGVAYRGPTVAFDAVLGARLLSLKCHLDRADELAMPTELQCLIAEMNWDV